MPWTTVGRAQAVATLPTPVRTRARPEAGQTPGHTAAAHRWAKKQRAAGKCRVCGGERPCETHLRKQRAANARYYIKHKAAVKARVAAYKARVKG